MPEALGPRATLVAVLRAAVLLALPLVLVLGACSSDQGSGGQGSPGSDDQSPDSHSPQETRSGASSPGPSPSPDPLVGTFDEYVALGDSFTAGPLIAPDDPEDETCGRSMVNYPRLLAQRLQVETLRDVSCNGAGTAHLTSPQRSPFGTSPPQLDALRRSTDLVTLGIGGNDFGVFSRLISTCARARAKDPDGAPCRGRLGGITDVFTQTRARVADALEAIHQRAPDAEVLVVGYPRLTPDDGTCTDVLPFAEGDYAFAQEVVRELNNALRQAASSTRAGFVDVAAAGDGHDACAGSAAWVNGQRTETGQALSYHPLRRGMVAVADLTHAELR